MFGYPENGTWFHQTSKTLLLWVSSKEDRYDEYIKNPWDAAIKYSKLREKKTNQKEQSATLKSTKSPSNNSFIWVPED